MALVSCEKKEPKESNFATPLPDAVTPPRPLPMKNGDVLDRERFIKEMISYIKMARNSRYPTDAAYPMLDLFSVWEPVGKSINELESKIGMPSYTRDGRLMYTLYDKGAGGRIFEFSISNGHVVKYRTYATD